MAESVLAKRFGHRTTQEPVVEPAPKPTVQAALASIADARSAISEAGEEWPDFCDYSANRDARLATLATQDQQIADNRKVNASLQHEIEDLRLDREQAIEQTRADKTVAQNDLARRRAAAERRGGGW